MKITQRNKIINLVLILSILSHITYLHNYLDDYILCYGNDGHITIEKLSDCNECSNLDLISTNIYFDYDDCTDFPILNSCFEDTEFLVDKKVNISLNLVSNKRYVLNPQPKTKHTQTIKYNTLKDSILESYSTISLLI